ncbi:hypothetical protein DITRI_Ditri05aG0131400 [Diplodiscus trichospermus]
MSFKNELSAKAIVKNAGWYATEFREMQVVSYLPSAIPRPSTWVEPLMSFYKLNCDACYHKEDRCVCCGVVMRDFSSQIIVVARQVFDGVSCPLHAELRAILFGLELIYQ